MKKVLITGASSGIGYSMAEVFAKNNYNLVLVARREDRLLSLKNRLENLYDSSIVIEVLDLSLEESPRLLWEKHKDINILINNAGFGDFGESKKSSLEKELDMIQLNISSLVALTKYYSSSMKIGDKIVNVGSTAGFQPIPLMSVYGASKSFVVDFTLAIQQEMVFPQIVLFCPGETQTEFQSVAGRPKSSALRGKIPISLEVAQYFYKELEKDKNLIIWGTYNRFLLSIQRFFSKQTIAKIIYKTQKR